MNLTLRARIFIIVSLVVLLILGISIILTIIFKGEKEEKTLPTEESTEQLIFDEQTGALLLPENTNFEKIDENLPIAPLNDREKLIAASLNMAKIFVERYGTYSTDNPGQNLKDLELLSTPDLWKVLQARIEGMSSSVEFSGIITKAFSSTLLSFEKEVLSIRVVAAREENKNGEIKNYNQEAEVTMVLQGDKLLVDNIKWK